MRINVYAEELTDETELITKTVTDDKFGTRTFYGLRFYLKSPPELHADPADDDRSAITIWVPRTRAGGHDFSSVELLLTDLDAKLSVARDGEEERANAALDPSYLEAVAACPTPAFHETHRYCPSCPWTEIGPIAPTAAS